MFQGNMHLLYTKKRKRGTHHSPFLLVIMIDNNFEGTTMPLTQVSERRSLLQQFPAQHDTCYMHSVQPQSLLPG